MSRSFCFLIALAALGLVPVQSQAALLAKGDANYLGFIDDGIPANESDVYGYLKKLITLPAGALPQSIAPADGQIYDRVGSTLAGPFAALPLTMTSLRTTSSNTLNFGTDKYQYITAKYDGPNYGTVVWYSAAGFTDVAVPTHMGGTDDSQYGLSSLTAFNKINGTGGGSGVVPEPASISAWLIGLACCGGFARMRKRTNVTAT